MTLSFLTIRGDGCTPRLAIVAPTAAICSGVARSRSCPIEAAPTARSSLRSRRELLGMAAPGTRGGALKPKRSAAASICLRPSLAPSGANTELQESVNDCISEPPHDSSLALRSFTPDSTAYWRTG